MDKSKKHTIHTLLNRILINLSLTWDSRPSCTESVAQHECKK